MRSIVTMTSYPERNVGESVNEWGATNLKTNNFSHKKIEDLSDNSMSKNMDFHAKAVIMPT